MKFFVISLFILFLFNSLSAKQFVLINPKEITQKYGKKTIEQLQKLEKPDTSYGMENGIDKRIPESQYPHALMYRKMIINGIGQSNWNRINQIKEKRLKEYLTSPLYKQQQFWLKETLEKSLEEEKK